MAFRIVIDIDPVAKGRPRFSVAGRERKVIVRTPVKTKDFENAIRGEIINALKVTRDRYPLFERDEPLAVDVDFVFKRIERLSRKKDPCGFMWKVSLPDLDNLQKALFDAFNEIIWHDDKQVVDLRVRKMYADKKSSDEARREPCVSVTVRKAPEMPVQIICSDMRHDRLIEEYQEEQDEKIEIEEFKLHRDGDEFDLFAPFYFKGI